jgi:osmotically-inducible protein OsmY
VYQRTATLTGNVQYEYQKRAAIQVARTMDGVSAVIDRIKIDPAVKRWEEDAHTPAASTEEIIEPLEQPPDSSDKPA